ncbi:hypothetical protein [Rothia sp. ZJ932]|uniref:hypothetical protein n=1 Tax=Rothia sp. ZJ932 TaxID=2810516 RepID=UPI0019679C04|nr:hypothetical protein [Rothia sp. ZJ932]QRZ60974.1 hypothetical protein JR346_06820 [Rothia sp. ZJ932]
MEFAHVVGAFDQMTAWVEAKHGDAEPEKALVVGREVRKVKARLEKESTGCIR